MTFGRDSKRSPPMPRVPSETSSRGLIAWVIAVAGAGLAAALTLPAREIDPDPATLFLLIAVSTLAGLWPVRIAAMRVELTATHPVVLCALAVAGPPAAVLTALAGVAGAVLQRHRTRLSRHLPFNLGAVALAASAAAWSYEWLGGAVAVGLEAMLWPLLGATAVYFVVNTALVSVAVSLEKGTSLVASWRDSFAWTVASYFSGFTLAVLLLVVVKILGPWGLALALPPCWLLVGFYRAHRERLTEQQRRIAEVEQLNAELEHTVAELRHAAAHVRQLQGLIPICMHCKSIRDDRQIWRRIDEYVAAHADVEFTHSLCEACRREHYPEIPLTACSSDQL